MKIRLNQFLLIMVMALFALSGFALESTLGLRGGISSSQTDIEEEVQINGMLGMSYEVWLARWLSLGVYPYVTRAQAGPATHGWTFPEIPMKQEGEYTGNFQSNLVGGDLLLKLRPNWKRVAPYIAGGGGLVNYFPKHRDGSKIEIDEYAYEVNYNANPDDDIAFEKIDYDYTVAVLPTLAAGIDIFTNIDVDFQLGGQVNFMGTDYLDGMEKDDDDDWFWMAYLGVSHTFGKGEKYMEEVVYPEPIEEEEYVEIEEPVIEEPEVVEIIPELNVSPASRNVGAAAGTTNFSITSNSDWTATENEDWLTVSPGSGTGNANFVVTYDANLGENPRTGYIYVTTAGITRTLTVVQAGTPKPALELKNVNFDFDKYDLTETARFILDADAIGLTHYKEVNVEIQGHTDYMGTERYNENLGMQRAEAVRDYLVSKGIYAARLTVVSKGELNPVSSNNTEEGRALNRRAELVVK